MMKLRRLLSIAVLAGAFALAAQSEANAQNSPVLDRVLQSGELRVGMSGNQPPFNVVSRGGSMIGIEVDLATVLAAAIGVELNIVNKPFGELLQALSAGEVDMVMSGVTITAERTREAAFVGPYVFSGKSILTKSAALAAAREAGEINRANLKLAALENSTSQMFIEQYLPEAQLILVKDYDEAVEMLRTDQISALVADMPICMLSLLRYPNEGLATLTQPLTVEPIGIAVPAGDPQFLNLMENYVEALEGAGVMELLRKKWLEDGSWIAALP
jgi:polar amino acid transport system substrate-binding protein